MLVQVQALVLVQVQALVLVLVQVQVQELVQALVQELVQALAQQEQVRRLETRQRLAPPGPGQAPGPGLWGS